MPTLEEFCQTFNWRPKDSIHLRKALHSDMGHLNTETRTILAQSACKVMEPLWPPPGNWEVTSYGEVLPQANSVIMLLTHEFLPAFISSPNIYRAPSLSWTLRFNHKIKWVTWVPPNKMALFEYTSTGLIVSPLATVMLAFCTFWMNTNTKFLVFMSQYSVLLHMWVDGREACFFYYNSFFSPYDERKDSRLGYLKIYHFGILIILSWSYLRNSRCKKDTLTLLCPPKSRK